jgi:hypothetical protein
MTAVPVSVSEVAMPDRPIAGDERALRLAVTYIATADR